MKDRWTQIVEVHDDLYECKPCKGVFFKTQNRYLDHVKFYHNELFHILAHAGIRRDIDNIHRM